MKNLIKSFAIAALVIGMGSQSAFAGGHGRERHDNGRHWDNHRHVWVENARYRPAYYNPYVVYAPQPVYYPVQPVAYYPQHQPAFGFSWIIR